MLFSVFSTFKTNIKSENYSIVKTHTRVKNCKVIIKLSFMTRVVNLQKQKVVVEKECLIMKT